MWDGAEIAYLIIYSAPNMKKAPLKPPFPNQCDKQQFSGMTYIRESVAYILII